MGWFLRRKKKYELTEGKYQSSGLRKDNKIKKANVDLVAQFDEIGSQAHTHTHTHLRCHFKQDSQEIKKLKITFKRGKMTLKFHLAGRRPANVNKNDSAVLSSSHRPRLKQKLVTFTKLPKKLRSYHHPLRTFFCFC